MKKMFDEKDLEEQLWAYNWVRYGAIEDALGIAIWKFMEQEGFETEDEALDCFHNVYDY